MCVGCGPRSSLAAMPAQMAPRSCESGRSRGSASRSARFRLNFMPTRTSRSFTSLSLRSLRSAAASPHTACALT
eukprot:scaffold35185_cov62-Phaeocystis_antarctica.AAC.4